jgi:hypothetical protein
MSKAGGGQDTVTQSLVFALSVPDLPLTNFNIQYATMIEAGNENHERRLQEVRKAEVCTKSHKIGLD